MNSPYLPKIMIIVSAMLLMNSSPFPISTLDDLHSAVNARDYNNAYALADNYVNVLISSYCSQMRSLSADQSYSEEEWDPWSLSSIYTLSSDISNEINNIEIDGSLSDYIYYYTNDALYLIAYLQAIKLFSMCETGNINAGVVFDDGAGYRWSEEEGLDKSLYIDRVASRDLYSPLAIPILCSLESTPSVQGAKRQAELVLQPTFISEPYANGWEKETYIRLKAACLRRLQTRIVSLGDIEYARAMEDDLKPLADSIAYYDNLHEQQYNELLEDISQYKTDLQKSWVDAVKASHRNKGDWITVNAAGFTREIEYYSPGSFYANTWICKKDSRFLYLKCTVDRLYNLYAWYLDDNGSVHYWGDPEPMDIGYRRRFTDQLINNVDYTDNVPVYYYYIIGNYGELFGHTVHFSTRVPAKYSDLYGIETVYSWNP